jgi:hypothetical protein
MKQTKRKMTSHVVHLEKQYDKKRNRYSQQI